jgi:hypothetical protein
VEVRLRLIGVKDAKIEPPGWPAAWPAPRAGDMVWDLPGASGGVLPPLLVRSVSRYPYGEPDPYVYVVLGPG